MLKRSLSFTFSNPVYLGPGQTTKTFDDAVLNNGQSYAYEAFRRTLTDTLYFYHADHLGTPIAMTDTSGALVWRAEHTPFGGIYALSVGTITNNLRFPGQYYDGETGLAQNYHRDYSSKLGRYAEPDPEDLLYLYVENQPVNDDDPAGLKRKHGRPKPKSFCEQLPAFPDAWANDIQGAIKSFCAAGQTDYPTVRCMVFAESSDNPSAENGPAMGLMQITPDTGRWIAWRLGIKEYSDDMLADPETNINFGVWYLNDLKQEFGNDMILMLAAYNAGRGNVARWLDRGLLKPNGSVDGIPFTETKAYIMKVIEAYYRYKRLYRD